MTGTEERYYNDIHRIADAMEKLVKIFTPQIIIPEDKTEEIAKKIAEKQFTTISPINISPSTLFNTFTCEECWYYKQMRDKYKQIEFGDSPCNTCPKMQVTCTATTNREGI